MAAAPGVVFAAVVVLVRAPQPNAIASEATVRLRGELVSAGFEVRVIDPPPGGDVRSSLERSAAAPRVEAVVAIVAGPSPGGWSNDETNFAELWVIDRITGKTVVRRVPYQPFSARAAEVLSVRALELLRASFLEVALAAKDAPSPVVTEPAPQEVTRWTDAALEVAVETRWPTTWAIEAGGCVLGSLDGIEASFMPLGRLQRTFGDRLLARVTVAGLGTPSRIIYSLSPTELGRGEVVQQFGLVEGGARWRTTQRWQPLLTVGIGALHVSASGQTQVPYDALAGDRWAVLMDVGAGVHLSFARRFGLAFEVHVQAAQPYPVIRFLGQEVAREGRPTLLSTLTLLAWM